MGKAGGAEYRDDHPENAENALSFRVGGQIAGEDTFRNQDASVAGQAGSPRAVRAAGNALGANPMPVVVPCHRVLRTGGALGGYTGGIERKEFLLRLEGRLP